MWNINHYYFADDKDDWFLSDMQAETTSDSNNLALSEDNFKLLIVDDDEDIHTVTQMVLEDFKFLGHDLTLLNAYSANHAKQLLEQNPDVAVILLDVVMETDSAGLELVDYIRNILGNPYVRIILRTGQPGQAHELQVVQQYDINDYRDKS